ncbi:MAG: hypothetical protein AAGI08_00165 [Bacteroidota bacterium]
MHDQAQAVLIAGVEGDEAALERFGVSRRSLQRYKRLAQEEGSELARVVAAYARELAGEPGKAHDFAGFLKGQIEAMSQLFFEKISGARLNSPAHYEAITNHVRALSERDVAGEYMGRLFQVEQSDKEAE